MNTAWEITSGGGRFDCGQKITALRRATYAPFGQREMIELLLKELPIVRFAG
jgi:hypothetical protein